MGRAIKGVNFHSPLKPIPLRYLPIKCVFHPRLGFIARSAIQEGELDDGRDALYFHRIQFSSFPSSLFFLFCFTAFYLWPLLLRKRERSSPWAILFCKSSAGAKTTSREIVSVATPPVGGMIVARPHFFPYDFLLLFLVPSSRSVSIYC